MQSLKTDRSQVNSNKSSIINIAVDGNEANQTNRVGSNVYAFGLLQALEKITRNGIGEDGNRSAGEGESAIASGAGSASDDEGTQINWTVLLQKPPISELPPARPRWRYQVLPSSFFWTQWALPVHLFTKKDHYDLFFTPGHYAPRLCPIPYVTSVMDTAYLTFPDQFRILDKLKLSLWTKFSVQNAAHVIAISQATKTDVVDLYDKDPDKVTVAYPALPKLPQSNTTSFTNKSLPAQKSTQKTLQKLGVQKPYLLFVGTLQPRKNLETLVTAFEKLKINKSDKLTPKLTQLESKLAPLDSKLDNLQLVLAGKVGWLAEDLIKKIEASPLKDNIILPGFVTEEQKKALLAEAECSVSLGFQEGFGIPVLESLAHQTLPVVANVGSLPEVVGKAGIMVDPYSVESIVSGLTKALTLSPAKKALYRRQARTQLQKFSWEKSAKTVVEFLRITCHNTC